MNLKVLITLAALLIEASAFAQELDTYYKLGPDSLEQEGVPRGKMVGPLNLLCQVYPERVLATDKKPIRAFFQDGRNDNRDLRRGGEYDPTRDWFLQNVRLVDALTKKGYDVNYVWGIGLHGQKQGGAIMPDMMRWLWRDHPVSVDVNDKVERAFQRPTTKAEGAE